ncbi:YceI family protein [Nonomuraea sp. NPDC050680]|uniref:YceI family protein n=1 Tax=Nonomuraea sp. NPDC050680 TaxID=3154630 RepID=UPI0033FC6923
MPTGTTATRPLRVLIGAEHVPTLRDNLACHGVTAEVPLRLQLEGFSETRVAFTAPSELSRKTFDVSIGLPLDGGGPVTGDRISVALAIQATLD